MKIVVKESNREKIEQAIKEAEGKATARTIDYSHIEHFIKRIEKRLNIPKKSMRGIVANVDYWADNFPSAYSYTPYSTNFIIEKVSTGWALVDVYRERTRRITQECILSLTEEAKEAIIASYEYV